MPAGPHECIGPSIYLLRAHPSLVHVAGPHEEQIVFCSTSHVQQHCCMLCQYPHAEIWMWSTDRPSAIPADPHERSPSTSTPDACTSSLCLSLWATQQNDRLLFYFTSATLTRIRCQSPHAGSSLSLKALSAIGTLISSFVWVVAVVNRLVSVQCRLISKLRYYSKRVRCALPSLHIAGSHEQQVVYFVYFTRATNTAV